tara:strand:- start:142 stop:717 length:576 start_codon:yes stop_codon:yes gene_type:complete
MGKRTKSARKAARKSSSASVRRRRPLSSSFLVFPMRRERGNSNPPIGETHSPLKNGFGIPYRALLVVPSSSKRPTTMASLFSSKLALLLTPFRRRRRPRKKKQKPARPKQRAPARKGYKIWTEPEKDALTAGVKKYGPGATTPPQTRRLFSSAPVFSLKGTTPSLPGVLFGRFFLSFSLSLSLPGSRFESS